jgi:hypothetical protein
VEKYGTTRQTARDDITQGREDAISLLITKASIETHTPLELTASKQITLVLSRKILYGEAYDKTGNVRIT